MAVKQTLGKIQNSKFNKKKKKKKKKFNVSNIKTKLHKNEVNKRETPFRQQLLDIQFGCDSVKKYIHEN